MPTGALRSELRSSSLSSAQLSSAQLSSAQLSSAQLSSAQLSESEIVLALISGRARDCPSAICAPSSAASSTLSRSSV
ncbi:pentapeptide repeat-containing protein [Streptomyces sp. NPDC096311]|uniref:pentapeptide repeat-containing protein n=1 Tax=Streptomyces sp. NPDC096311 TaxID=3366083 RepID=UPI0037FB966B